MDRNEERRQFPSQLKNGYPSNQNKASFCRNKILNLSMTTVTNFISKIFPLTVLFCEAYFSFCDISKGNTCRIAAAAHLQRSFGQSVLLAVVLKVQSGQRSTCCICLG
ncbi:hypothetical protein T07_12204 [Trichinella nelsoni]|uniref:Uncharacterized protein n=1 Tax=Trichinella nelsoni TaxID=6336 RepID=A0A0V0RKE9_9BILA|nr:hypothetical protein T07_12204 [Trichinella nelsoni]